MHPFDDETTTPASELSGVDARSAGWALSGVTMLVLVVGLLVIRSTRSETEASDPIGPQRAVLAEVPATEPRQRTIVLEAADVPDQSNRRRDPRVLPATGTTERAARTSPRSASTGRQDPAAFDRL